MPELTDQLRQIECFEVSDRSKESRLLLCGYKPKTLESLEHMYVVRSACGRLMV
jgi:hypothetical protein